jgi:two-component system, chemotaxis family, sensor kinase Cph1
MMESPEVEPAARTTIDLDACAREPIHVPGAIQPHGVLAVLREPDCTVIQVSANVVELGVPEPDTVLGRPVAELLGEDAAGAIHAALERPELAGANPVRLRTGRAGSERSWDAILHRAEGGVVLELEPASDDDPRSISRLYEHVRHALRRLQATRSLADLCETVAEEVRRMTRLDRVMVYRFDEEWNGEVVAESRAPDVDGFLGLRFPASDIPAQARELYRRNWLRLIADAGYKPSAIVPEINPDTGAPLDLSGSELRSVSPVHLEYLRNMDVGASMSVSLLRDGELWGLIACHHRDPVLLPYDVRAACEFLGQTFSVQLAGVVDEAERAYALELAAVGGRILDRAAGRDDWAAALVDGEPSLAALAGADGAAVWAGGRAHRAGVTPDDRAIAGLARWLAERRTPLFATDRLSDEFPDAAAWQDVGSGLLAAAIGGERGEFLMWFRGEAVRTVTWAGNPEKPVDVVTTGAAAADGATPRLHPRRSFAAWSETVRGQSLPWRAAERDAAAAIRDRIVEIVLRQADVLARLNSELRRSNEELEAFTYIASHDLKEPLRGIHSFAEMIRDDHGDALGREGGQQLETVLRLARRMDAMLDSFLRYSRAGQLELRTVEVDMQQLLDEVLDTLATRVGEAGAEVRVPRPLPVQRCDPIRAASVIQNLISNALKYTASDAPRVEVGYEEPGGGRPTVFRVSDNGIGIAPEQHEAVFRLFRRLHARDRYGGGTGAGLTIAKRLVERHGGRIWIESEPDAGSTFMFTLAPEPE